MKSIKSWIDEYIKTSHGGDLFGAIVTCLSCFVILFGIVYCISNFEPQIFFDWYLEKIYAYRVFDMDFQDAYIYSIDPARNFFLRIMYLLNIFFMWFGNCVMFIFCTMALFLIMKRLLADCGLSHTKVIYITLLLLFNLSFIRLLHGSQNNSVLLGVNLFLIWQCLILYFPAKRIWFFLILILSSWANLLIFPLTLFGCYQYYVKGKIGDKIITPVVIIAALFVPLYQKNILLGQEYFYLMAFPIDLSSYVEFPDAVLGFKQNLLGVIGAMGKVILPFGTRQYYQNLAFSDYLGLFLVLIFIFWPLYFLKKREIITSKMGIGILGFISLGLVWPLLYRNFFVLDKITSLHLSTTAFFQGINNDDLIAFYILSYLPFLFFLSKVKVFKKEYLLGALLLQIAIIGSYAPKIFKTKSYIASQLNYEPNHELLNLSYLFYLNRNKEKFDQDKAFEPKVILDRSSNEKLKLLGSFWFNSMVNRDGPSNYLEFEVAQYEKTNFHPLLMIQVYLYFQNFNKLKQAQYDLVMDHRYNSNFKVKSNFRTNRIKRAHYWEAFYYLGLESLVSKAQNQALNFFLLAYMYADTSDREKKVVKELTKITDIPVDELVKRKLGDEK